jgi:opacity protein-like surface antigen
MKKLLIALIAGTTLMGAAHAQGPYIGAGVSTTDNTSPTGFAGGDKHKAAAKVFGGYDISDKFGVEAGYTDFRKTRSASTGTTAGSGEADAKSMYVAAKMTAPINEQFSVYGKLGAAHNRAEFNSTIAGANRKASDNEAYAGLGGEFHLNKQVGISVEYERFGKKKDFGPKPDTFTVAARYKF